MDDFLELHETEAEGVEVLELILKLCIKHIFLPKNNSLSFQVKCESRS